MIVFDIQWHETATGTHVSPHSKHPSHLPPQSIPLGFPRTSGFPEQCPVSCIKLALVIYFTYGNIYVSVLCFQIIPPSLSTRVQKSVLYICVSFAALHIEWWNHLMVKMKILNCQPRSMTDARKFLKMWWDPLTKRLKCFFSLVCVVLHLGTIDVPP